MPSVKKGRDDEAKEILARYHANGDTEDELVNFEIAEIKEALAIEEVYESKGIIRPWLDLVSTKANRYRMFIITFLVIGIDWCGTSITSYYVSPDHEGGPLGVSRNSGRLCRIFLCLLIFEAHLAVLLLRTYRADIWVSSPRF